MADYKLWNALKDAKKYRWVELSHSLNNESPYCCLLYTSPSPRDTR